MTTEPQVPTFIDLTGYASDSETEPMRETIDLTSDEDLSDLESGWEQSMIVNPTISAPGQVL